MKTFIHIQPYYGIYKQVTNLNFSESSPIKNRIQRVIKKASLEIIC